jgi:hypothetical protein
MLSAARSASIFNSWAIAISNFLKGCKMKTIPETLVLILGAAGLFAAEWLFARVTVRVIYGG